MLKIKCIKIAFTHKITRLKDLMKKVMHKLNRTDMDRQLDDGVKIDEDLFFNCQIKECQLSWTVGAEQRWPSLKHFKRSAPTYLRNFGTIFSDTLNNREFYQEQKLIYAGNQPLQPLLSEWRIYQGSTLSSFADCNFKLKIASGLIFMKIV